MFPGSKTARGRLQVSEEIQRVQHQQLVDQSAGHPEGAGGEHPRHGDHRQPQAAGGRG